METKTLIQSTANVIKITNVTKGTVLKMIDDSSYSTEISYIIVIDMMNSGDKTFIEVLKYKKNYGSVDAEILIFSGDKDIALFPCDVSELEDFFGDTIESIDKKIEDKKEELQKLITGRDKAKEFISGELSKKLTIASYEEITQPEYNEQKRLKEEQIKMLQSN